MRTGEVADRAGVNVAVGMTGSPTLLVDGTDPFAVPGLVASVSCRLYLGQTGAATGAPSVAQLRAVLAGPPPATPAGGGLTLAGWRAAETGGRQAALPPGLPRLHQAVLRHFLGEGHAPDRAWMQEQAARLGLDPGTAIRQLTAADLVHLGRNGVVSVAYPFSGVPSGHRVQVAGGPAVWAMCAIDALGISRLAERDVTITAADPASGDPIRVEAHAGAWRWAPSMTVVLVAQTGTAGSSADCTCGHVNFYSHAEHALAYLDEHPELAGRVLDQATAVELAGGVFGGLLRSDTQVDARA